MQNLIDYARSFLGLPYIYGGNNPLTGMDCSGFVCEVLKSAGVIGHREDLSAQQLYDRFSLNGSVGVEQLGALAFFGKSVVDVGHVGILIDPYRMIEAGGGESTTVNLEEAKKRNAFVKIRPFKYRSDFLVTIRPRYSSIGAG